MIVPMTINKVAIAGSPDPHFRQHTIASQHFSLADCPTDQLQNTLSNSGAPKCTSLYCTIVSIPITYVRYCCAISRQRFSLADCPMATATYGWFVCPHFHPKHNNKICDDSFHPRLNNVLFPNCKCWRSCPWFHLVSLDFTNWSVSGMLAQAARIVRICWVLSPRFPQSGCTQTHEWRLCTEKCQSVRCSEEGGEDHQSADLPTDIYGRWWWCRLPTTPMLKPNCWLKIPKFELDLK